MGGTFDPVHLGHLIGAQAALNNLGLDKVIFVPAANPPHKPGLPISPARHRVAMLEKALAGNDNFSVWLDEIKREGNSYTIDTLRRFSKTLSPGDELYYILGADNLNELVTWKEWENICREAKLVALDRIGSQVSRKEIEAKLGVKVLWVDMPLIGISATSIRNACARGKSIRYMVPDQVADYIAEMGLYRESRG